MKDLLGDNIPQKTKRKEGILKSIYFATIACPNFEQLGFIEDRKTNLKTILDRSFSKTNPNFNEDDETYSYDCDNHTYYMRVIEITNDYYFGQIYTDKKYDDLLEEYRDSANNENLKSIIIRYFTFFYIDIKKQAIVYIGQKGLKGINKLFSRFLSEYSKSDVAIHYLADKNLLNKLEHSQKLQSIEFQISDEGGVINKSLDKTLNWERGINTFIVSIKVKKPTLLFLKQMLNDKQKHQKIKKPILKFQDTYFNDYISNLFEDSFSIQTKLTLDDIDMKKYDRIKDKLENALNTYYME